MQWSEKLEMQRRRDISEPGGSGLGRGRKSSSLVRFVNAYKEAHPTIDHFQLRHLVQCTGNNTVVKFVKIPTPIALILVLHLQLRCVHA
jgi:hypothetical protein